MLETISTTAVAVEEPVAVLVSLDSSFTADECQEYARVAKQIGFTNIPFLEQKLLHFLATNGICVFPYEKVEAFLDSKFGKAQIETDQEGTRYTFTRNRTWGWRPLRQCDVVEAAHFFNPGVGRNGEALNQDGWYRRNKVPLPVLLTVEKISQEFSEVSFYVSDQVTAADYRQDPFLMIRANGIEPMVIERWNEPSFRM